MALSLKLNGSTTASIPGSPSTGDAITMDNGLLRVTFTYSDHISTLWSLDKIERFDGSSWLLASYGRDRIRLSVGGTEKTGTDVLTLITNDGSVLTLKLAWGSSVSQGGVNWSSNVVFTMRTSHNYLELTPSFSSDGNYTGTVDFYGAGYLSGGKASAVNKVFCYGDSPVSGNTSAPRLFKNGNATPGRTFGKINSSATIANNFQRGYGNGGAYLLRTSNVQLEVFYDPASYVNLLETLGGVICYIYGAGGYASWWQTVDLKYRSEHSDGTQYVISPGVTKINTTTNTVYTVKAWVNAEVLEDDHDSTIVRQFNSFALNSSGKMTVAPSASTLTAYSAAVEATMASNYSTAFNSTYGFYVHTGDNTQFNSFANALALQGALKLYKATGSADYLTNATRIKNILLNKFQITSGVQKGAFQKIWAGSSFKCQEGGHSSNTDHPHIPMYVHAENTLALLEYYNLNGGSDVATSLNDSCDYLVRSINPLGYWVTELNNANVPTTQNPNTGSTSPGSNTVLNGYLLLAWASLNSSHENYLSWRNTGILALNYWRDNQTNPHGTYEYGEGQVAYSSHALRMIIEGFGRAYELTGDSTYQEALTYYMEMAVAQTKKYDTVFNSSSSNNVDIHTGGLLCTLDWNGQVGPEALSIMATMATTGLKNIKNVKAHHLFYLYAMRNHTSYGMFNTDYTTVAAYGYSYLSPGTNYAATGSLDNTRMAFHAGSGALFLVPHFYSVVSNNDNVYISHTEEENSKIGSDDKKVVLYNPQATTQTVQVTLKNLANPKHVRYSTESPSSITSVTGTSTTLVLNVVLTPDQILRLDVSNGVRQLSDRPSSGTRSLSGVRPIVSRSLI